MNESEPLGFTQDFESGGPSFIEFETPSISISGKREDQNEKRKKKKAEKKNFGSTAEKIARSFTKGAASEKKASVVGKKKEKKTEVRRIRSRSKGDIEPLFKNGVKKLQIAKRENKVPNLYLAMLGLMTAFGEISKMVELPQ